MTTMETMQEALRRLERSGYRDQFRAQDDGLVAVEADRTYAPESLQVEEVVRFEGSSNPGDQSAVFALRSPDGAVRGTYVVAYGPSMATADVDVVKRLSDPS